MAQAQAKYAVYSSRGEEYQTVVMCADHLADAKIDGANEVVYRTDDDCDCEYCKSPYAKRA